jgi:adenylosuccinate synthase
MKEYQVVLGAGFGDEGKGRVVSYLTSLYHDPLIVRFSGGHQAGHTVSYEGKRHVFSHFGSGTLQGAKTYWSKYCTVYPVGLMNEWKALNKLGVTPEIHIDDFCPVTTPYDIYENRNREFANNHGSCGLGFGTTIERHDTYKLYFQDLFIDKIFKAKLNNIVNHYYKEKKDSPLFNFNLDLRMLNFLESVNELRKVYKKVDFKREFWSTANIIFEGSQGILLDKDLGFFPNVTRANTDLTNVYKILKEVRGLENPRLQVNFVSRVYQTRHGNGYMSNENTLDLINNEDETNTKNSYQGSFRTGYLDLDLLKYSIDNVRVNAGYNRLCFTCLDQIKGDTVKVIHHDEEIEVPKEGIGELLGYKNSLYFYGASVEDTPIEGEKVIIKVGKL